eukprot:8165625-Pyramimonas_sp.AAC.1
MKAPKTEPNEGRKRKDVAALQEPGVERTFAAAFCAHMGPIGECPKTAQELNEKMIGALHAAADETLPE